jgi:4-alpha-glucanotransferase
VADEARARDLAERLGIQRGFWDVAGQWHDAPMWATLAAAAAMGVAVDPDGRLDEAVAAMEHFVTQHLEPVVEPVAVVWDDEPLVLAVRAASVPAKVTIELDLDTARHELAFDHADGAVRVAQPSGGWPRGRHRLRIDVNGETHTTVVLAAPRRVPGPANNARQWGVFAPVYAPQGGGGLGAHLGVLDQLGRAIAALGGQVVGTLPMLATFLDAPYDPSPYSPVSRRWWNEAHLDVAALPELDAAGRSLVARLAAEGGPAGPVAAAGGERFDARAQSAAVHEVLAHLVATFDTWPAASRAALEEWLAVHPDAADYGRFRAAAHRYGTGWQAWPAEVRDRALTDDDGDPGLARRHVVAQFLLARQLRELATSLSSREVALYLDLPLGSHGGGYDTWRHRDLYVWGAAVGAPPDEFFVEGQNWGFPPPSPVALRADGYAHLAQVFAGHLAVAGVVRLDHVMALHRLYWVPDGRSAREGVYVHYRLEELFAVLAIEAGRHECMVVGEDLGTVPDEIRAAMADHGLLGMYVAEFEVPEWPGGPVGLPSAVQAAFIDTHDTPTLAAWLADDRDGRAVQIDNLRATVAGHGHLDESNLGGEDSGELTAGLVNLLGASPSPLVLISVDDLWGETEPQNVPGTPADRPNWVHRYPYTVAELAADERVRRILGDLQGSRLDAHLRAQGDT